MKVLLSDHVILVQNHLVFHKNFFEALLYVMFYDSIEINKHWDDYMSGTLCSVTEASLWKGVGISGMKTSLCWLP